jgi:HEPN domain-containing protein|tara:strand:- start:186 stop:485 length:300 start_codon:yes stop_codon:yes gene_type:complete
MNINKKIELAEEYLEIWREDLEKAEWNVEKGEDDLQFYLKARQMGYTDDDDIDRTKVARALREDGLEDDDDILDFGEEAEFETEQKYFSDGVPHRYKNT